MSEKNIRNDLEFYIPQLCTFSIFGEYEVVEEFLAFLCKACYASFFFAHRVLWFLKSLLNSSSPMNEKIEYIIQLIQAIFKSNEKEKLKLERLYIANSKKYIDIVQKKDMLILYSGKEIKEDVLDKNQKEFLQNIRTSQNLLETFIDKQLVYSEELEKYKHSKQYLPQEFKWNFYLNPDEVLITIFKNKIMDSVLKSETGMENGDTEGDIFSGTDGGGFKSIDQGDVNLSSFLSSINFVDLLCSICEKMKDIPNEQQMSFLFKEFSNINKSLPSNVYIPFLKDSIRNYLICHIPITEMKIFRTKNRAPYMLTVELIRIDEIISVFLNKEKRKLQQLLNGRSDRNLENLNYDNSLNYLPQGRSYSMATSNHDANDDIKLLVNKNDMTYTIEKTKHNSFLETSQIKEKRDKKQLQEIKKRNLTQQLLAESDIRLSRPVVISNLEADKKRTPFLGEKKIILEENPEYEESFAKEDVNEMVKRKLTMIPMVKTKNNSFKLDKDSNDDNNNIENPEEGDEETKFKQRKNKNLTVSGTCGVITVNNKDNTRASNKENDEQTKNRTKPKIGEEDYESIKSSRESKENEIIDNEQDIPPMKVEYEKIFGELIEHQKDRLKKTSPFGKFNTWTLFKMIIKSGEDLRQEQFATQLINEFHQIFQIEKVNCWVNTYEIIATGNNVGIIECVPNAISIDQLKKKIKNNSLRQFYENYFGPVNSRSNSFKK